MRIECDYLVIGTGVAGLTFARAVAGKGRVLMLSKLEAEESATNQAQGGVASVTSVEDSFESHIDDTLRAGRGLCRREVVELCVRDGPARIRELREIGARFSMCEGHPGELDLGREGGHSKRRIVHAADATGREMVRALLESVRALPDVEIREHVMAVDLIVPRRRHGDRVCKGAFAIDKLSGEIHTIMAPVTVLATGGAGKVYLYTSNPNVATGDGIAMGYRAGAAVANMEFFQFHPTILYHPVAREGQLISEAVRGEGGILRTLSGEPFMKHHHPAAELAPRDVVALAIDREMKHSGDDHVLLDVTHLEAGFLAGRFPNISERCRRYDIDIATQPIPVVPAAHFSCGGLITDTFGRTTVPGLFALGETACTGLHGANRLASNSLLEGLVFSQRAGRVAADVPRPDFGDMPDWHKGEAVPSDESVVVSQDWDELRRYMWNYVGIVRTDRRLRRARRRHDMLLEEIREYYWNYEVTADLLELRNIATVAHLIIECAMRRKESRGLHHNLDYPDEDGRLAVDTLIARFGDGGGAVEAAVG